MDRTTDFGENTQNMMDGTVQTDEALWKAAADGDMDAQELLAERYAKLVRRVARPYFLVGGEGEDLLQEGMIGLLFAIRQYDPRRQAAFPSFAETCVRNRIYTAIRDALRSKHSPLNGYISFQSPQMEACELPSAEGDPERILLEKEQVSEVLRAAEDRLSRLERQVLRLYLDGLSYGEIARILEKDCKAVDNAVQRIRRKLQ